MKKIVIGTILVVLLLCSCEQMFYDNSSLSAPDIESANSQIYVSNPLKYFKEFKQRSLSTT